MKRTHWALRRRLMIVSAVFAVLLSLGACTGEAEGSQEPEEQPVALRVLRPEIRTMEVRLSYLGTVHATVEVPLVARVQGTLVSTPVSEGGFFGEGDLIARLSAPEMEAAVERLSSERDYWCRRHETDTRLAAEGALPEEQADSSRRACRSAEAGLAEAEAQLAKTVVTAPFPGQLLDRLAEVGQPVMPGQPLALVGQRGREVRVEVVEEDLSRGVTVGTAAEINLGGSSVEGRVSRISPAASGPARTFTVAVPVPEPQGSALRKGASLGVDLIPERRSDVVAVPLRAIADRDRDPHLFVITESRAVRHPVSLGIVQDGWVSAEFSWNGEDPVAVTNVTGLSDGAAVYAVAEQGDD
jgi:RND family efflux transporter MFP subunit